MCERAQLLSGHLWVKRGKKKKMYMWRGNPLQHAKIQSTAVGHTLVLMAHPDQKSLHLMIIMRDYGDYLNRTLLICRHCTNIHWYQMSLCDSWGKFVLCCWKIFIEHKFDCSLHISKFKKASFIRLLCIVHRIAVASWQYMHCGVCSATQTKFKSCSHVSCFCGLIQF